MNNENIIEVRDMTFSYSGRAVLEEVSVTIHAGEFVAIIGPNGGGKTTLIKLMMGLIHPRRGSIRLFGRSPFEARGRFGYTPQHSRLDLDFPVTVMDVVLLGRLGPRISLGPFRKKDRNAAEHALSEVDCLGLARRPFSALSGGERQRVLIARALTSQPEVLFLDEPSANLDPSVQDDFHELLHVLNKRMAVIIVSHDVGFVSRHVETVLCVNRQVHTHLTSELKGAVLEGLYRDMGVRVVDHGHSHNH